MVHLPQTFLQHGLQRIDAGCHDAFHIRIVALVHEPDAESRHGHQGQEEGEVHHHADPVLKITPSAIAAAPPGEGRYEKESQNGKQEALHHIVQPFRTGPGNDDDFPFGDIVDEVAPAFLVHMAGRLLVGQLLQQARVDGGIRIKALVLHQMVIGIFGPGIDGRKGDASRFRDAQQAQIAPVFPVVLGFHRDQYRAGTVVPYIIGEQTRIGGAAAADGAVEEMGALAELDASLDAFLEHGTGAYVAAGQEDGDVVVLGDAAHVGAHQAVADDVSTAVQYGKGSDHGIGRDGIFRASQLDFQGDVPVHGQPVGPDVHPVLFLLEAQHGRGRHKIHAHHDGKADAAAHGEHVIAEPRQGTQDGRENLDKQRNGERQGQEGNVNDGRIRAQEGDFIQFQRNAGVHRNAPESEVDIQDDGGNGNPDAERRHHLQPAAVPAAEALQKGPAHHI